MDAIGGSSPIIQCNLASFRFNRRLYRMVHDVFNMGMVHLHEMHFLTHAGVSYRIK